MAITHLLLDIEGTTCPVSFVAEVLFPFAREALPGVLARHGHTPEVAALVQAVDEAWQNDSHPEAQALLTQAGRDADETAAQRVVPYLQWLIDRDIKLTALKDLQGRVWADGYGSGTITAPLFDDVADALRRWHRDGMVLAVYSSGSVPAQQLLYRHSQDGDLSSLFSHWFDTRIGAKQHTDSYTRIADAMGVKAEQVLFISDALTELEAAHGAGMAVLLSDRPGNPNRDSGPFERISDYRQLHPGHGPQ
ncbi:MAG: acireductone synthase [Cyanobacteria bacterium K_Offshore_0m_m2_072]|nr:acireductone synthase [Cyanobacteria bacterium K_Offshore_0m_m2_072]